MGLRAAGPPHGEAGCTPMEAPAGGEAFGSSSEPMVAFGWCALRPCLLSQRTAPGCGRELAEGGLCAVLAGIVGRTQPLTLSPEVGFPAPSILETLRGAPLCFHLAEGDAGS